MAERRPMPTCTSKKRKVVYTSVIRMFKYKSKDEPRIIKILIEDMSPSKALEMDSGLPADILFLCLRHAIYTMDEKKAKSFLLNIVEAIETIILDEWPNNMNVHALWLANICRIINNCKTYSNIELAAGICTDELENTAILILQTILANMKELVAAYINVNFLSEEWLTIDLYLMLRKFRNWKTILILHNVHSKLICRIFKLVFQLLCAEIFNFTINCEQMMIWLIGVRIRNFLNRVLEWCVENKMADDVIETLQPLDQAADLLYWVEMGLCDTDDDVTAISEKCFVLSTSQILTLLSKAANAGKSMLWPFIEMVGNVRRESGRPCKKDNLYMKTEFLVPLDLPFCPYEKRLEETEIPSLLHELQRILQLAYISHTKSIDK